MTERDQGAKRLPAAKGASVVAIPGPARLRAGFLVIERTIT